MQLRLNDRQWDQVKAALQGARSLAASDNTAAVAAGDGARTGTTGSLMDSLSDVLTEMARAEHKRARVEAEGKLFAGRRAAAERGSQKALQGSQPGTTPGTDVQ